MMTAGAYDIATEHAILVEASAAGVWRALPEALLFGLLLGAVYDLFRIPAAVSEQKMENGSPDSGENTLTARLRRCRCRSVRGVTAAEGEQTRPPACRRLSAQVSQFMLDMLFFLVCGVSGAVFLYWRNSGILRWYLILGGAIGFFAYSRSLGRWMLPLFQLGISVIRAGMCALYNGILYYPVYMIDRVLYGMGLLCKKAGNAVVRTIQRRRCRRRIRKILCTEEPVQKKRRPRRQKAKE